MIDKTIVETGSVSTGEIDHFAGLAAEWWDPNGDFKSLHEINPLRMTYIRDQICSHYRRGIDDFEPLSNLSVIDVGCGGGLICEPLARLGADVTGIDAVDESIEVAKSHSNTMSLAMAYKTSLPEELEAKVRRYDV